MSHTAKQQIVIIGGGFAGINLIKKIDTHLYDITLIDQNNFHAFPPLFYQIASSGLEPAAICFPFRQELRKLKQVRFHMGNAKSVDTKEQTVTTDSGILHYDYLIIATGTTNNFFNINNLQESVFTLKSTAEAIRVRNEVLNNLELASTCSDPELKKSLLCFAVVGGGPTGVEIAGALGEMKKYILQREYPELKKEDVRVIIIEGTDKLLRTMSPIASEKARTYLQQLEVEIKLNKSLVSYDKEVLQFNDGETLACRTVIWTAGVTGVLIDGLPKEVIGRGNRILTDEYNRIKGYDNIFALGDIALMITEACPSGHPQLAQVAIQQGRLLAKHLNNRKFDTPFIYNDMGSMATIGRNRAVADFTHMHMYGRPAWFMWMFVHLISLLGMKNKIFVLLNWTWNYFTYNASLRLLIRPTFYPIRKKWKEPIS